MNDHDSVEIATAPPQDTGLSSRGLWQVFTSPTQLFRRLKDQPKILVPMLVLAAATMLVAYFTADLSYRAEVQMMKKFGQVPEPSVLKTVLSASVVRWIEALLAASLAMFWGNFVFAGSARFKQLFSVFLYGCVLYEIGSLLKVPMILAADSLAVNFGLGFLAKGSMMFSASFAVFSRLELFFFWQLGVVAIGLAAVYRFTLSRGILIACLSHGLLSAIFVGFQILIGSFLS